MATIRSKNSNKTLATLSGTLVVRCRPSGSPDKSDVDTAWFAAEIDARPTIRRIGEVTERRTDTVIELRADVEYGPVFGGYASDLRRQLETILSASITDRAVFHIRRRELTDDDIVRLRDAVDDVSLTLPARARLSELLSRLDR
jgi:hypothetical protein